jgi:hypothetical protein
MLGSCIMTMPLLMTRSLSGTFLAKKIYIEIGPSTIFARFGPVQLLAIPKTEDHFEGPQIFTHCQHSGTCDDHLAEHSRRTVSEIVFHSENTDSLSVLVCKETTSKVTATISVKVIKYSFYRCIPGT